LLATGIAGRPEEYLRRDWLQQYQANGRLDPAHRIVGLPPVSRTNGFAGFLAAVLAAGTTDNGVFGAKVHWDQFAAAADAVAADVPSLSSDVTFLRWWVPGVRLVHLTRRDRLRQALSHYRARRSGQWIQTGSDRAEGPNDVDFAEVDSLMERNIAWDRSWEALFARAGIEPIRIVYEDLATDYAGILSGLTDRLGLTPSPSPAALPPRLRRQADRWTDTQVAAYLDARSHEPIDAA
jgi:LPS sulfotransferase NodH